MTVVQNSERKAGGKNEARDIHGITSFKTKSIHESMVDRNLIGSFRHTTLFRRLFQSTIADAKEL